MPESFVRVPPDSTGKMLRHRERVVGSNTVHTPFVIPTTERVVSSRVTYNTFRTLGAAATTQTLFTLENGASSGVLVAIRRLAVYMDTTADLTAVVPSLRTYRTTNTPSAGTVLTKGLFDTTMTSSAGVVARGATASDGGAATAITATMASSAIWDAMGQRLHTAVGQVLTDPISVLPQLIESEPFILRAGESLAVQVNAAATSSNPATNHYIVNAMLEEFTLP